MADILHSVDALIASISYVNLAGGIIVVINPTQGYVRLTGTVLQPSLNFVQILSTIQTKSVSPQNTVNFAGTLQTASRNYVRLVGTILNDKLPTHSVDAAVATQNRGYVQLTATTVAPLARGICGSFPDASFVNLAAWIVIAGDSIQMPNSGFTASDDFLSSQLALQAYKPVSIISLAGYNLIVTAFTPLVVSWQTRTRGWLTRLDEAPGGILIKTTADTHTLPNGAVITTTTQIYQIQDITKTVVTIANSATPSRVSTIVTEQTKSGQTVTTETDTSTINGTINKLTKKSLFTEPPTKDNIQPITVRTLDGITHYQFFDQVNPEWAGGDAEGLTTTSSQQQIIPGTLNGSSVDPYGNPILTRITNTTETDPLGKVIETRLEETGIRDVGTTTTNETDSFNGIIEKTHKVITYPDGSQTIQDITKNKSTGEIVEVSNETVTDEYGQVTTTVTNTDIKTFVDPSSGVLRTVTTKTVTVTKGGVTTTDTKVDTTDDYEDSLINDKVKVIFIQEFTITSVMDEMTMLALAEINMDNQRSFALLELFSQQLGNASLTYALRQRLINQYNTADDCVNTSVLQANGRIYQVVFAPSASAFRPKLILGTEPHVYECQFIIQVRSDLVMGTVGF